MALSLATFAVSTFLVTYAMNEYHCSPNQPCTIDCIDSTSCAGKSLYCPSNNECIINCDLSSSSCQHSTIYAKDSSFLSITITNTDSITIYAPSSTTNSTKSIITCNTLTQCQNLKIYATRGFNDIDLRCNDTSSCDISGSMQCGYDTQYTYDECTNFQYISSDIGYQCQDSNFCQFRTSPSDRIIPTFSIQNESISDKKQTRIEHLHVIIVAASVISCVIVAIAGFCGFLYFRVKNNRKDSADQTPSIRPTLDAIGSDETNDISNDQIMYTAGSSASSYTGHDDTEFSTSDALGLTAAKFVGIICHSHNKEGYTQKDDKSKSMQESISPNSLLDIDLELRNIHNLEDDAHNSLSSGSFFGESTPSERSRVKLDTVFSPSAGDGDVVEEDGSIHTKDVDGSMETTNIVLPNLPSVPPPKLHTIAEYEPELTEQQRAIRMQNILNLARSYGYQQPEILYEDDENFTEETSESSSRLSMEQKEKGITSPPPRKKHRSTISITRHIQSPQQSQQSLRKESEESRKIPIERRKASTVTNDGAYTLSLAMSHEILSDDEELPSLPGKPVAFLFSDDDGDREYCD